MARLRYQGEQGEAPELQHGGGFQSGQPPQQVGGPGGAPWPGFGSAEDFPLGQPSNLPNIDLGKGLSGRGETTGREEGTAKLRSAAGAGGGDIAPRRPSEPTPMAGSSQTIAPPQGPVPFDPMQMPSMGSLAQPRGGLYGKSGGMQGGGLGVPFDPTSDIESDPISTLMQLLAQAGKV